MATPVAGPDVTSTVDSVVLRVVELDLNDGSEVWETHVAGPIIQPVASGSLITFTGTPVEMENGEPVEPAEEDWSTQLTGIDAASGEILWTTPTGDDHFIVKAGSDAGVVAAGSGAIYLVSSTGEVQPLSDEDGTIFVSSLKVVDGVAVTSLMDGSLAAFSIESE